MFVQAEVFAVTRLTSEVKASSLFPAWHRVLEKTGLRLGLCSRSSFSISRNILRPFYQTFIESLITFSFICSFDGLSDITRVWVRSTIAGVQLKALTSTGPELRDEMIKMSNVVPFLLCSYFVAMDKTDWKVNRPWGLINDLHQKAEDQTELRVHSGAGSRGRLSSWPNGSQPKCFVFFAPAATRVNTRRQLVDGMCDIPPPRLSIPGRPYLTSSPRPLPIVRPFVLTAEVRLVCPLMSLRITAVCLPFSLNAFHNV